MAKHELALREAREKKGLSLREAARQLEITHAYLSALELGHKPLHKDRAVAIAKLYNLPRNSVLVQPLPQDKEEFLVWQRGQVKWWDSRFVLPMIPAVTKLITDLHVEPQFLTGDGRYQPYSEMLSDFFKDELNRALIVTGNIGTGKSFFMKTLALNSDSVAESLNLSTKYVPILISLGEFSVSQGSLTQSLVEYFKNHGFDGSTVQLDTFFQKCIQRGNALLLFDGLDEISNHSRRVETLARLQQHYEDLIKESGSKMVITGRPDAFFERDRRYEGFRLVRIEPWHAAQMYESCERWSWDNADQGERFWLIVQSNDNLYRLAQWPLLFHLLTTLHSSSGLQPFQELSGLCNACCEVLENSWDSARRAYQRSTHAGGDSDDPLELHPWLKWRHFLIHLMERSLDRALESDSAFQLSFSPGEMKEAWESFLSKRGVERNSMMYTRLEDLISNQNRIGPVFYHRNISISGELTRISERFSFLDSLFGHYYLVKALVNKGPALEQILPRHLRDLSWEEVLPLTIQDLGRSDRSYETELGERLIALCLAADDSLGLEHRHSIGHFGLLNAMRSVATYNFERYWEPIVKPFVSLYMTSIYERDVSAAFKILGEYSASPPLRRYILEMYDEVLQKERDGETIVDSKWRTLAAVAKVGERTTTAVEEIVNDLREFLEHESQRSVEGRIGMRRLLWSLRQIGRLLIREQHSENISSTRSENIEKLRQAVMDYVRFARSSLEKELQNESFSSFHFWDELTVIVQTQHQLLYSEDLRDTVVLFAETIRDRFQECFEKYPHRRQLIQFLKAAFRHSYVVPVELATEVANKFRALSETAPKEECNELAIIVKLLDLREETNIPQLDQAALFTDVFGAVDAKQMKRWIDEVKRQDKNAHPSFVTLGEAVYGISRGHALLSELKSPYSRQDTAKALLKALECEHRLGTIEREQERIFTQPFTDYGFPLYDHIYNCLVRLARDMPVTVQEPS